MEELIFYIFDVGLTELRYIVIFLASKLFNFALSLLFLRISDNFSTGPEYVMRTLHQLFFQEQTTSQKNHKISFQQKRVKIVLF